MMIKDSVPSELAISDGHLLLSADLSSEIVGYKAQRCHRPLDLSARGKSALARIFTSIYQPESSYLFPEKMNFIF